MGTVVGTRVGFGVGLGVGFLVGFGLRGLGVDRFVGSGDGRIVRTELGIAEGMGDGVGNTEGVIDG